ncbi:hypothetical protein BDY24DRAFT_395354 [Mrakia frigida]|uniref:uncharacterized protein n=1 Tax=Mrakia frigida TaxID=29902 RepID=UPI003FCC1895
MGLLIVLNPTDRRSSSCISSRLLVLVCFCFAHLTPSYLHTKTHLGRLFFLYLIPKKPPTYLSHPHAPPISVLHSALLTTRRFWFRFSIHGPLCLASLLCPLLSFPFVD